MRRCLQLVVTGEIPDARTVPVKRAVAHPTVARLLIAIVFALKLSNDSDVVHLVRVTGKNASYIEYVPV